MISTREMREEIGLQRREMVRGHRDVGLAPPDGVGGFGILDDELVLGAAAGVLARRDDERAILGKQAFAVAAGLFDKLRGGPVRGHIRFRLDRHIADHNLGHCLRLSIARRRRCIPMQCLAR